MDRDFFKSIKIMDGGMGQLLLEKGMISKGTLWSAGALVDDKYHDLIKDCHLSYINSGADVIVTNTFSCRKFRLKENNIEDQFKYLNKKACELAIQAKQISKKNILIAGSLPSQRDTYVSDVRSDYEIENDITEQTEILSEYVDFFYLDVVSSIKEIKIASKIANDLKKNVVVGVHTKKDGKLPSGENLQNLLNNGINENCIGIIFACVSPEIAEKSIRIINEYKIPFGAKVNLWKIEEPTPIKTFNTAKPKEIGTNPNISFGKRDDITNKDFYDFSKKIIGMGATILGGCCETNPQHIQEISKLKQ